MKIIYELNEGIVLNGVRLPWGIDRTEARELIGLPYKVSDKVFDPKEFGVDSPVITQYRDVYGDIDSSYFFLNYGADLGLSEFEAHVFGEFQVAGFTLLFDQPLAQVLAKLRGLSLEANQEGEYFEFPALKLSVASHEGMGGEDGDDGLSYVYVAASVDHWKRNT